MSTIDQSLQNSARFVFYESPLYVIGAIVMDKLPSSSRTLILANVMIVTVALALFYQALFTNGWWLT